jgi:WD40 repeat protein
MYAFNPVSEAFVPLGSLIAGRVLFVAVTLADGNVLVIGGASGAPNAVIVNTQTGIAVPTPNQPHSVRVSATSTLLRDGKVLIVGGLISTGSVVGTATDRTAEVYDPATGTFTVLSQSPSVGRYGHTAIATPLNSVFIYGGLTDTGEAAPPELFDAFTGTFTVLTAPESNARINHAAVPTLDGTIFIVGGDDSNSVSALASVISFDPFLKTFSHATDLATPRTMVAAAPLTYGPFLVAGGATDRALSQIANSSELIAVSAVPRSDGPPMSISRYAHTMSLLSNGKVLIVGGLDQSGNTLASAEIYE